jgi:hypothetical protein
MTASSGPVPLSVAKGMLRHVMMTTAYRASTPPALKAQESTKKVAWVCVGDRLQRPMEVWRPCVIPPREMKRALLSCDEGSMVSLAEGAQMFRVFQPSLALFQ